jgi:hypothetical protein
MTTWIVIERQQYNENTPEYGCGDYPDQIDYIAAVVTADTPRKAQNAAKKVLPRVRFGGMFGAQLKRADDPMAYLYIQPADPRLWGKALARHQHSLAQLNGG